MNSFTIYGRLDGLNEYVRACRNSKYGANSMKKKNQKMVEVAVLNALRSGELTKPNKFPIGLKINWYEPNKRRDIDNVQFAVKFILDALVEMKVIPNDSRTYVDSIINQVDSDKQMPRIHVEVVESDNRRESIIGSE